MSTRLIIPATTVTVAGHPAVPLRGSRVALDETTSYAIADLTLPLINEADIEDIDPRDGVRTVITSSIDGGTPRVFDLGIRSRTVDHAAKTIRVEAASDEALLGDYAPLVDDLTPLDHQDSLRDVIDYVLDVVIPGTSLEATPSDDALVTLLDVDNLVENPSVEVNTTGWQFWKNSASGTDARVSGTTPEGDYFYRCSFTSTAAGPQAGAFYTIDRGVKEGTSYSAGAWVRTNFAQTMKLRFEWKEEDGTTISAASGPDVAIPADTWVRITIVDQVAPPLAVKGVATIYGAPSGVTWNNGKRLDVDGLRIGPTASEPLNWRAGVSAWDFLLNLTAAAHLRLFCDELRAWRLVPQGYTVPGVVSATPATAKSGTDTIDREGDLWADGVLARWRWDGPDGTTHEMTDTAGTPGKVQVLEFRQPYPGPGAAAFRLKRLQGQGRTQESVAFTDYAATPGMEARQTLPGTLDQIGRLQSVEFGLTDGFMVIRSRGLTDAPPTAYLFGDPGISYNDVPIGMTYDDFDWTAI